MPVLQLVMRQVQLHDMGTEGRDLSLLSSPADPTAAQHQHTGDVQTIWGGRRRAWMEESEKDSVFLNKGKTKAVPEGLSLAPLTHLS